MVVRAALRDTIGTRFELRQGDPADSVIDRRAAMTVPGDQPGRGHHPRQAALPRRAAAGRRRPSHRPPCRRRGRPQLRLTQAWNGPPAPPVRLLPREFPATALPRCPSTPTAAAGRRRRSGSPSTTCRPVQLDFATDPHFLAFGDVESGKTVAAAPARRGHRREVHAERGGDHRRGLPARPARRGPRPHLLGYAGSEPVLAGFIAEVVQAHADAAARSRRHPGAAAHAVVVERARSCSSSLDDYELIAASAKNPLHQLLEFLPQSRDIGLHVLMTRGAGGAGRGLFEPVVQRLRELGTPGLMMSGPEGRGRPARRRQGPAAAARAGARSCTAGSAPNWCSCRGARRPTSRPFPARPPRRSA